MRRHGYVLGRPHGAAMRAPCVLASRRLHLAVSGTPFPGTHYSCSGPAARKRASRYERAEAGTGDHEADVLARGLLLLVGGAPAWQKRTIRARAGPIGASSSSTRGARRPAPRASRERQRLTFWNIRIVHGSSRTEGSLAKSSIFVNG